MSWDTRHNQVDIAFRGAKLLAELSGPLGSEQCRWTLRCLDHKRASKLHQISSKMNWELNSKFRLLQILPKAGSSQAFASCSLTSFKFLISRKTALISPSFNKNFKNADSDPHTHSFPSLNWRICIFNKSPSPPPPRPGSHNAEVEWQPFAKYAFHRARIVIDTMRWELRQGRALAVAQECRCSEKWNI